MRNFVFVKITVNREKEIRSKTDDPKRHISQNGICAFSLLLGCFP